MKLLALLATLALVGNAAAATYTCVKDTPTVTCPHTECGANCGTLVAGTLVTAATDCDTNGAGKCDTGRCQSGYFLLTAAGDTQHTCSACEDANVLTCETATKALSCKPGYFLDGSGDTIGCTACATTDITCDDGDGFKALTTACPGSTTAQLDKAAACTACANTGSTGGTCTDCGEGALTCSSATVALTCDLQCTTEGCSSYFKDSDVCTKCEDVNVLTCDTATKATECKPGYFLDGSGDTIACTACATTGITCDAGDGFKTTAVLEATDCAGDTDAQLTKATACTACPNAASTKTDGTCDACGANVATCETATKATTCETGYYLNAAGGCTVCVAPTPSPTPTPGGDVPAGTKAAAGSVQASLSVLLAGLALAMFARQ